MYKYYLTKRPAAPGSIPTGATEVINYDNKTYIQKIDCKAWALVSYPEKLAPEVIRNYELTPEDMEPNRKQLELTAGRLLMKSGYKGKEALAAVQNMTLNELLAIIA